MFPRLDNPVGFQHIGVIEYVGMLCLVDDVDCRPTASWPLDLLSTLDGVTASEVEYVCKLEFV